MSDKIQILHEGELLLNDIAISCYVLEDGRRVLSSREMQRSLRLVDDDSDTQSSGARLKRYLDQKSLKPFIFKGKPEGHYDPIICYKGEQKINGYEATVLVDICDAFMQARKEITLSSRQAIIAEQCEILVRSFAKVGLISLIDEATGYQYDRERFELQKILKAYISEEILKWQLTFTDDFYKEMFRLWGIPFIPKFIKRKPQFIGRLTNTYIYEQLPGGVLDAIKGNTPKTKSGNYKYKFHQSLSPDVGREHLKKQITEVTTLMTIADTKEDFQALFKKKYHQDPQKELELLFTEDDKKKPKQKVDDQQSTLNFNPE